MNPATSLNPGIGTTSPNPGIGTTDPTSINFPGAEALMANVINSTSTTSKNGNIVSSQSFKFAQFLEEGSYGNEVKELQKVLNNAGYEIGKVDGIFGAKVKEALIKFQTANNLKADGMVGYEMRTFLNK